MHFVFCALGLLSSEESEENPLFRTILSQSCWPGIILVQCRGSLCNVVTTFGATGYYQKINRSKIKIAEKDVAQKTIHLPFSCRIFYGVPGYYTGHLAVKYCPSSIKTTLNSSFSSAMLSRATWTTLYKDFVYLCNVVPRVLRQNWTRIFPVQRCLEPLGQHWTRILPVQCCPKSIKTTLNYKFSCAMMSGASWTTLHKDFTCAILSQEYLNNIEQESFLCKVVWSLLGNIAQGHFTCAILSQEY